MIFNQADIGKGAMLRRLMFIKEPSEIRAKIEDNEIKDKEN